MGVFGTKSVVGVYADADSLSILNAKENGSTVETLGFSTTIGLGGMHADANKNQPFIDKIKRSFQEAGVRAKTASLAVSAEGSMIRYFDLPVLPKKEEKNAVRFEAQKYVPFDMKDLYYDYERYSDTTVGGRARIIFFACKKQWVDQISSLILLAGAKVMRVELACQAVVRAFCHASTKKTGQVQAMVFPNDDQRSAELILFKENSVLFARRISFTQQQDSVTPDIPFFISEMRISFDYFFENFKNEKIATIHLVVASPDASRQSLREIMQKELSLPVELFVFPQKTGSDQVLTTGTAASYGLVLADLSPDKNKGINLKHPDAAVATIPWEEEKKQLQALAVKEIIGIAAALLGIFVFSSSMISSKNNELQRAFASYPKPESASIQDSMNDLQMKKTQLIIKTTFGAALLDRRNYLTTKMNELAKTVPSRVRLTRLHYDDAINNRGSSDLVLHIEGYALFSEAGNELSTINELMQRLSENKDFLTGFEEIKLASTKKATLRGAPATKFILDCVRTSGN